MRRSDCRIELANDVADMIGNGPRRDEEQLSDGLVGFVLGY